MYNYVTNKKLISSMRSCCGDMMQDLCHTLKEESNIGAEITLVGSGARNLILQNANEPIDLDYNLKIVRSDVGIVNISRNALEKLLILFLENMDGEIVKIPNPH